MPVLANPKHEKFAQLIASGLKPTESYVKAGYKKAGAAASANRLRKNALVCERIDELAGKVAENVVTAASAEVLASIANREERLKRIDLRVKLMDQLRTERAAEMLANAKEKSVPGAATGLLCRVIKAYGSGANMKLVPEYAFDKALFSEMRELEKQAAQEVGDWTEKKQITGKDGGALTVELIDSWLDEDEALKDDGGTPSKKS